MRNANTVKNRAFSPAPPTVVNTDYLKQLYGTDKITPKFTETDFLLQFDILINEILRLAESYKLDNIDALKDIISKFKEKFKNKTLGPSQGDDYFEHIKKNLEIIVCELNSKERDETEKKRVLNDLISNLVVCGPGVFEHINDALANLFSEKNISAWLAKLRSTIIKQIAETHIREKNIPPGSSIHVHIMLQKHANQNGLHLPAENEQESLDDTYGINAQLTEQDLSEYMEEFHRRYTPEAIVREIAQQLNDFIHHRLNQKKTEPNGQVTWTKISNYGDLKRLFDDMPFLDENGALQVLFQEEEKPPETDKDHFSYAEKYYFARPVNELMIHLTEHFRKCDGEEKRFFSYIERDIDGGQLILIPGSPELNYVIRVNQYQEGILTPIDKDELFKKNKHEIERTLFKNHKIPIYTNQFNYFINDKKQNDFSGCVLVDLDLSEIDIKNLNFADVEFKNVKLTIQQLTEIITKFPTAKFLGETTLKRDGGADRAQKNKDGLTPIQLAARLQNWDAVRAILKNAPDEDDTHQFNYGPALLSAARAKQFNIVKELVNKKADLTWFDTDTKNTALHYAVIYKNIDAITELIKNGANPALKNKAGLTPIQLAARLKNWDAVKAIAEKSPAEDDTHKFNYGDALLYAADDEQFDIVGQLVDKNAQLNWSFVNIKNTALHYAAFYRNTDAIEKLIKKGADPALKNELGYTPIQFAARVQYWDAVRAIAENSPDEGYRHRFNYGDALLYAAKGNQFDIVIELLKKNALPSWYNPEDGNTALHYAAIYNNTEVIEILIKKGTNLAFLNTEKKTAIELAVEKGHWNFVHEYNKRSPTSALHFAVINKKRDMIEKLWAHDQNAVTEEAEQRKPKQSFRRRLFGLKPLMKSLLELEKEMNSNFLYNVCYPIQTIDLAILPDASPAPNSPAPYAPSIPNTETNASAPLSRFSPLLFAMPATHDATPTHPNSPPASPKI